ncbi:hypothetical protein OAF91_02245 [Akkermansiaceae bacterium]|jgi:hypothetical protein|nr:hypothetical protein [Akkermansiaceae bacterium]
MAKKEKQQTTSNPLLATLYNLFGWLAIIASSLIFLIALFGGNGAAAIASLTVVLPMFIGGAFFIGIAEVIGLIAQIADNTRTTANNSAIISSNTYAAVQQAQQTPPAQF